MTHLIKNGHLITASESFQADLLIEGEKIIQVGQDLSAPSAQVFDASGKFITPGGVDPHTHFDLPMFGTVSSDDHYTGHKAAAFGGTTTVIDFVSLDFPTFRESVDAWHAKAQKAAVDYSFHMNLTRLDDSLAAEIASLPDMGITTLKVFTAYNNRLRLDDGLIFRAMRIARDNGMLAMLHAENGDVIETLVAEALAAGKPPEWHAHVQPGALSKPPCVLQPWPLRRMPHCTSST
jgi:dihydropyrimidinase